MMGYWLVKTEPDTFSIEDLRRQGRVLWDGVRNYQARNYLRQMQHGDDVMIYHSSCKIPAVVGLARVDSEVVVDESAFNPQSPYFDSKSDASEPRWFTRYLAYQAHWQPVSRAQLAKEACFHEAELFTRPRLSVMPLNAEQFAQICRLAGYRQGA